MISVVIPVYNQAKIIPACLKSVFNQTYKDLEVIVVNDGSTDNLRQVLRAWETRIKLINQSNQGAPAARNTGFKQATGKYVIFCDADIVMQPDMLKEMRQVLEMKPAFAYVYCSFKMGFKKFKLFPFDENRLRRMPYIHTTSLMRSKVFPGFDESLHKFQDWDLWLTLLEQGHKGVWLDKVLFSIKAQGSMSKWLPKFMYNLPCLKTVRQYKQAKKIIQTKHQL